MKEIKFEAPVSESKLKKILLESFKKLTLAGQWHFEHGYSFDGLEVHAMCEKVRGNISGLPGDYIDFEVYAWADDSFQEPMFAGIKFIPPCSELGQKFYDTNIDKTYEVFQENYKKLK